MGEEDQPSDVNIWNLGFIAGGFLNYGLALHSSHLNAEITNVDIKLADCMVRKPIQISLII